MQDNPGDISYFQYIQAQQFPHLNQFQPNPYTVSQIPTESHPCEIYENPSEHYASINNYGQVLNNHIARPTQQSLPGHRFPNSSFGSHVRQTKTSSLKPGAELPIHFYGYGPDDQGTGSSDYDNDIDPLPAVGGEHYRESSHSETEREKIDKPIINNNNNRPLPTPPSFPRENKRKNSSHDLVR